MKRIEFRNCAICGGSYRVDSETGKLYPIYDAPTPCSCEGGPTPDPRQ